MGGGSAGHGSDNANSKACTHDYADSQRSSHTKNGITDYGELDAYCVGFAWDEGAETVETVYKANTLFQMSMVQGFWEKDLRGALPGAPMCGCVEKMPVVTHVECVKPSIQGDTVEYIPCAEGDNGLVEYYEGLFPEETEKIEALEKKIVNTCEEGASSFWKEYGYAKGSAWWHASSDTWTLSQGTSFSIIPQSRKMIFRRRTKTAIPKLSGECALPAKYLTEIRTIAALPARPNCQTGWIWWRSSHLASKRRTTKWALISTYIPHTRMPSPGRIHGSFAIIVPTRDTLANVAPPRKPPSNGLQRMVAHTARTLPII